MSAPPHKVGPLYLVVMGVAGSGKSVVAEQLAKQLQWPFVEGDHFHPAANLEKMQAGIPLNDLDRAPWLRLIAEAIEAWRVAGTSGVITCSALRRRYRTMISAGKNDVWFVYLRGDRDIIDRRMRERRGHFMPISLLDSQLETLEEPSPAEQAITVDISLEAKPLVANIVLAVRRLLGEPS